MAKGGQTQPSDHVVFCLLRTDCRRRIILLNDSARCLPVTPSHPNIRFDRMGRNGRGITVFLDDSVDVRYPANGDALTRKTIAFADVIERGISIELSFIAGFFEPHVVFTDCKRFVRRISDYSRP